MFYLVDPLPGHVSLECCDVFLVDAVLGTDLHHFTSDQEALLLVRCGHIVFLTSTTSRIAKLGFIETPICEEGEDRFLSY